MKTFVLTLAVVLIVGGLWITYSRPAVAPESAITPSASAEPSGDALQQVQALLAAKYERALADVAVTEGAHDATHMAGTVSFAMRRFAPITDSPIRC
jgi:hypothetical protein